MDFQGEISWLNEKNKENIKIFEHLQMWMVHVMMASKAP